MKLFKESKSLNKINFYLFYFINCFLIVKIIFYSVDWIEDEKKIFPKTLNIYGNLILSVQEILDLANIPINKSLLKMDLTLIQQEIQKHPYIKIANLSREFPNQININIKERVPLAYLNLEEYLVIDDDGFILPLRNGIIEFNIPTLTGFNKEQSLYPIGFKCISTKALEAVENLNFAKKHFPTLLENLSEFTINQNDYFEMILTEKPTKIIFKNNSFEDQIFLLREFNYLINKSKSLEDYKYVDLRYKNQIVVKERI